MNAYKNGQAKPSFTFTENTICITLPVLMSAQTDRTTEIIMHMLIGAKEMSRKELEEITGIKKASLIRALNTLISNNRIEKTGAGRNIKYHMKR
jgi:ATP-dependent DNA helicase RecG